MQQRVALARTLSLDAGLWLMDEPFAALDELTRERLAGELLDLWQPAAPHRAVGHPQHPRSPAPGRPRAGALRPARRACCWTCP